MSFQSLPSEIKIHILKYLNATDIYNMTRVSQGMIDLLELASKTCFRTKLLLEAATVYGSVTQTAIEYLKYNNDHDLGIVEMLVKEGALADMIYPYVDTIYYSKNLDVSNYLKTRQIVNQRYNYENTNRHLLFHEIFQIKEDLMKQQTKHAHPLMALCLQNPCELLETRGFSDREILTLRAAGFFIPAVISCVRGVDLKKIITDKTRYSFTINPHMTDLDLLEYILIDTDDPLSRPIDVSLKMYNQKLFTLRPFRVKATSGPVNEEFNKMTRFKVYFGNLSPHHTRGYVIETTVDNGVNVVIWKNNGCLADVSRRKAVQKVFMTNIGDTLVVGSSIYAMIPIFGN